MKRSCEACQWFVPLSETSAAGDCHGAPPAQVIFTDAGGRQHCQTLWPNVQRTDWCGAFRLSEHLLAAQRHLSADEDVRLVALAEVQG